VSRTGVTASPLVITAADGYPIGAIRYTGGSPATATIIVAGATGVAQRFYRRFAEYAASDGYDVVTLDYRGLGASAPADLRGFEMDYADWARLDLDAVIGAVADARPLFIVGHSYGGVAFGLVPRIAEVDAIYTFGSGAGWHGWMPRREAARVLALWHLVGPVATRATGVMPGVLIGLGADMPLGVYRGWKRWVGHRRNFFDVPEMAEAAGVAARVRIPVAAANSVDDLWALPRSRDALMSGYSSIELTPIDIVPSERGIAAVGHTGYFRESAAALWADALDWLDAHRDRLTAPA
jgi:predicted alpha/beta hydrolase